MTIDKEKARRWYADPNIPEWKKGAVRYRKKRQRELAEESRGHWAVHHKPELGLRPKPPTGPEAELFLTKLMSSTTFQSGDTGRSSRKDSKK